MRHAIVSMLTGLVLWTGAWATNPAGPPPGPVHDVRVECEPGTHRMRATATLLVSQVPEGDLHLALNPGLRVSSARLDGQPVEGIRMLPPSEGEEIRSWVVVPVERRLDGWHRVSVDYEGEIYDPPEVASFSRSMVADETRGTIQSEGIFLPPSAAWYPTLESEELSTFRVEVILPPGWEAVVEGDRLVREVGPAATRTVYATSDPMEGVHLVAGPWTLVERDHGGITVAAYVFPEDTDLAGSYLPAVEDYLDLYGERLGPYAFSRFAVVENFFPTGYGMPGFTVLGREVMRLPFIVRTSLGHEVAHNWWGNGVRVDEARGNWCEGLTVYVADYHYKERESEEAAAEYRREVARDYTNYVSEEARDFRLTEFTERSTPATRAVGYGKTMMVFHMLERRLGRSGFDAVLRRVYAEHLHRRASWNTWRDAFSREAGEDLGWFFAQWVERPGAPVLGLQGVRVEPPSRRSSDPDESGWTVSGTLLQRGGTWRIRVPVVFEAGDRRERRNVETDRGETTFRFRLPFEPAVMRVDPDQDIFRRLDPMEMPPVLSKVLGDPTTLFLVDDSGDPERTEAYRAMADILTRTGEGEIAMASAVGERDTVGRTVMFLGRPRKEGLAALLSEMPGEVSLLKDGFRVAGTEFREAEASLLAVARHPGDADRAVALFEGLSAGAVEAAGGKLVHYGKYSYLAFVAGRNRAKGVAAVTGGPLVHRFP